MTKFTIII